MKKSQLRQLVLEAIGGYENKDGKLVPHSDKFDSTKLSSILTAIAKGRPEEESEEQPEDIQEDGDTTRAKDLGTLRGALMHVQALLNAERPHNEILAFVEKSLQQTKASDPLSEGAEQDYVVIFYVNDMDYDWDVKATSPEDAIAKVKSGEVKGPYDQKLPRTARGFTAKLK